MSRLKRQWVSQEAGSFHIISRVVGDTFLLGSKEKEHFVKLIQRFSQGYFVRVHAYCIMDNHFHMLVTGMELDAQQATKDDLLKRYKLMYGKNAEPPEGRYSGNGEIIPDKDGGIERLRNRLASVSRFVQELKQGFSRWYNKANKRTGYFWGSRFKGVIITHGDWQLVVSSYIDLNPVRAGITVKPEDYRWSSLGFRTRSPVKASKFIHPLSLADIRERSENSFSWPTIDLAALAKRDMGLGWYREFVYISGGVEREGKAQIPQHLIDEVVACNGHLGLSGRLGYRIRNFSEGIALGSQSAITRLQEKEKRKYIRPRPLKDLPWAFATRVLTD